MARSYVSMGPACCLGALATLAVFVIGAVALPGMSSEPVRHQEDVLPYTDPACFIEEFAGLIGAFYDTEEFDRQKAKVIISEFLGGVGLETAVAKMLYVSRRELVPLLALEESVPEDVYRLFDYVLNRECNGPGRRLEEVSMDEATAADVVVSGEEEVLDIASSLRRLRQLNSVASATSEKATGKNLRTPEEAADTEAAVAVLRRLVTEVSEETSEIAKEEENVETTNAVEFEQGAVETPKVRDSEGMLASVEPTVGEDSVVKKEEEAESVELTAIPEAFDGLLSTATQSAQDFFSQTFGDRVDFLGLLESAGGIVNPISSEVESRDASRQLIRDCSFLTSIDERCFIIEYSGFVGASWDTEEFDRQKAAFVVDSFLTRPDVRRNVSRLMCLAADMLIPQIAGDTSITQGDIDLFFAEVPGTCALP